MSTYSRKSFLALSAGAVLTQAPLARAATQFLEHADAALLPRPGRSGIEHVVVVMMENRSFDHFLGWLPGADGQQAGLKYVDPNGHTQSTYRLAPDFQGCGHVDPDHSYDGGRVQYNGGKCDGFLRTNGDDRFAIGYYTGADLPFLGHAAADWTTCDRYFAAIMAVDLSQPRLPARGADRPALTNPHVTLRLPTIWDRLAAKGLRGRATTTTDVPFLALWGDKYKSIIRPYRRLPRRLHDAAACPMSPSSTHASRTRASEGLSADDHPHGDIRAGESFLNQIYQAVTTEQELGFDGARHQLRRVGRLLRPRAAAARARRHRQDGSSAASACPASWSHRSRADATWPIPSSITRRSCG